MLDRSDESTTFQIACVLGDVEEIKRLSNETNINAVAPDGLGTPLMMACTTGHYEAVKVLLELGADVSTRGEEGHTALHRAALMPEQPRILELLIDAGSDVNAVAYDDRHTPLMMACQGGCYEDVRVLLKLGADVHMRDAQGHTALKWAGLKLDQPRLLELLIDAGADVNTRTHFGLTPLCYSAMAGFRGNCRILLKRGARRAEMCGKWTAEELARRYEQHEVAEDIRSWDSAAPH